MKKFALMSGNTVSNIIAADNKEQTEAALKCILIEITDEVPADIGWVWDGSKFIAPEPITDELS